MVGMPAADSRVRSRNICPPGTKISFWVGRSAPPDSTSEITGNQFCRAIVFARSIFRRVHGLLVPPLTVGSLATIRHSTPLTAPMPTTVLAPIWKALPYAASGLSSRNGESGSTSSSMRSRAVSLPRAWCRSTYLGPPPPSALANSASISSSREVAADAASVYAAAFGSSVDRSTVMTTADDAERSDEEEAVQSRLIPKEFGGECGEDFGGAAADTEDSHVPVLAFDFGFGHVTHPAEQLDGLVGHPLARLDGGVLRETHLRDEVGLAGQLPLDHVVRVDAGDIDATGHLGERVLHRLPGYQRTAECLPVAAPLCGDVQAPLCARIRLRGKRDPLGDESLGDLGKAGVLDADEVGRGYPRIGVGQLGGVRGPPTHLVQLAGDLEAGRAFLDRQQRNPGRTRATRAHRGDDVVGPYPRGDVGLGAVDDVVVAVTDRGGPQVADVGAAAGLGDGQCADQLTGQRRADELVDQPGIAGRDHVRHRDAAGEQRREHAAGHAGLM